MDDPRLSRIETKLDQLAEAMLNLVRIEERTVTLFRRVDNIDTAVLDFNRRVIEIERVSAGRGYAIRFMERVFWIVLTAAVGAAFVYFRGD